MRVSDRTSLLLSHRRTARDRSEHTRKYGSVTTRRAGAMGCPERSARTECSKTGVPKRTQPGGGATGLRSDT
jgi:hypothetical protein